jgi:hypothetical protein
LFERQKEKDNPQGTRRAPRRHTLAHKKQHLKDQREKGPSQTTTKEEEEETRRQKQHQQ